MPNVASLPNAVPALDPQLFKILAQQSQPLHISSSFLFPFLFQWREEKEGRWLGGQRCTPSTMCMFVWIFVHAPHVHVYLYLQCKYSICLQKKKDRDLPCRDYILKLNKREATKEGCSTHIQKFMNSILLLMSLWITWILDSLKCFSRLCMKRLLTTSFHNN